MSLIYHHNENCCKINHYLTPSSLTSWFFFLVDLLSFLVISSLLRVLLLTWMIVCNQRWQEKFHSILCKALWDFFCWWQSSRNTKVEKNRSAFLIYDLRLFISRPLQKNSNKSKNIYPLKINTILWISVVKSNLYVQTAINYSQNLNLNCIKRVKF